MKFSHLLKQINLYKTAVKTQDFYRKQLFGCYLRIYKAKLRSYRNSLSTDFKPRVLVIMNAGGLGNVIEATPLVQAVKSHWPKSEITLLSLKGDLFDNWCIIDRTVNSIEQLNSENFDHVFCPYWYYSHSDYIKLTQNCEIGCFHRVKVPFNNQIFLKPERQYSLDMIRKLGFKGDPPLYVSIKTPTIDIPISDLRICLVPGGKDEDRWKYKKWPYYSELADLIIQKYRDVQILIIGTPSDYIPEQINNNPNVIDLRGKLSIAETAWVLKSADIAVGNDCGPMHIADAVQTKSIVIFGPTCELKNGPEYKAVPITSEHACRPCQYSNAILDCSKPSCIEEITPSCVMEQLKSLISKYIKKQAPPE